MRGQHENQSHLFYPVSIEHWIPASYHLRWIRKPFAVNCERLFKEQVMGRSLESLTGAPVHKLREANDLSPMAMATASSLKAKTYVQDQASRPRFTRRSPFTIQSALPVTSESLISPELLARSHLTLRIAGACGSSQ
jgi:hypothetical protein